ncbi:MAG TPA: tripartite tricarboxylate transporter substrate-binding protein, partial [Xanthobacteraceae bacterium]|nr:tripartite tricarboxylate transporter substrate-binding protein [Xanthobacteraceae bacterium]
MKLARRVVLRLAAGAAALAAFARTTRAQLYPSRPITIIVPVPPGGVADPIARILADHLTVALGQPVVVENVTGAGGSIGVARAARAAPDGYTISIGNWLSHVGASAVYPVQYDVLKDFAAVSLLTNSPMLITARKDFPANDLKALIAWLKANPDKATAATVGAGSAAHVSGVYFQRATDTRFQFVPYRGGGPAVQDEVAGHVDLMFNEGTGALPYVLSHQIKTYA